jgi:hypothetical protein
MAGPEKASRETGINLQARRPSPIASSLCPSAASIDVEEKNVRDLKLDVLFNLSGHTDLSRHVRY